MSQDTRKDRRAKIVSLNVRYKSATVDEFIENHSHDVSKGGLFIKTPTPFPPGTLLKFEIRIASDKAVIAGVGRVVWKREPTQAGTERPAGMGVKFIKVDDASRATIDRVVGTTSSPGTNFESEMPEEKPSPSVPANPAAIPRGPLVRRATMAGLGEGSIRPEDISAALTESGYPPPARGASASPAIHVPAAAPLPGTAAAAAALKAMPTVPRPMFPGQLQSLLHEEPVKEPTMMKQAAELLEEALKEAGGSMADIGENPLFNRPSRHPRPLPSTPQGMHQGTQPGAAVESALSATKTLADPPAGPPSARATTTAIGLPPPPGLKLGGASSSPPIAASAAAMGTAKTLASPGPPKVTTAAFAPGDEPPTVARKAPSIPPPIPVGALPSDTTPELLASESDIAAATSEDAIPKAAALSVRTPEPASARLPAVSARAQLGSRSDAERRSGGGGIIWAGLGVVVVFGLFGVYKMGLFGGSGDQPAPSATAVDTGAPSASAPGTSAAPSASASSDAVMAALGDSGAATAPSATSSATSTAAATTTTATATTKPAATATATVAPPPVIRRPRPKPTATEDDSTPDTPPSTSTATTSTSTAATSTATAAPTSTSTAAAPTATSTATSTAKPTTTATAAPTSTSTAAPTATMRRTIGTAAPTANDSPP